MDTFFDILEVILCIIALPFIAVFTAVFAVLGCVFYLLALPYLGIRYIMEEKQ